jgi:hypothetical protein
VSWLVHARTRWARYNDPVLRFGILLAVIAAFPAGDRFSAGAVAPTAKLCTVHHSTEVRYRGFGYDHVVHISNACDEEVACVIKASSNPKNIDVKVPGQRRIAVIARRMSASSKFTASVYCKAGG